MDRRDFLLATGGAAIGAVAPLDSDASAGLAGNSPAAAASARRLSFASHGFSAVSWGGDQAHRFAGFVRELSGGTLVCDHDDGGALAVLPSQFRANVTDADVTWCGEDDLVALHPAFAFATGLPGQFALNAHDAWAWQQVGGGQDLIDALAAPFGLKVLLAGHRGHRPLLWSHDPIESLAQLSGAKVHARGLHGKVFAGLGASSMRLVDDDLGAAMAARVIAGAELGGPMDGASASVARVAKFVVPGLAAPQGTALVVAVRLSVWEQLSERERALIAAAAARQHQLTLAEDRGYGPMMLSALAARSGVTIGVLPREITVAAETISRAVVAETAALDVASQRLNASYMAFRAAVEGATGSGVA